MPIASLLIFCRPIFVQITVLAAFFEGIKECVNQKKTIFLIYYQVRGQGDKMVLELQQNVLVILTDWQIMGVSKTRDGPP